MALAKVKTEAGKRNGNGRWMPRAEAKHAANKHRRKNDKKATKED